MTRRLLFLLLAKKAIAGPRVATDPQKLNDFAKQYNVYVNRLKEGIIDLKEWERLVRAWRTLAGE